MNTKAKCDYCDEVFGNIREHVKACVFRPPKVICQMEGHHFSMRFVKKWKETPICTNESPSLNAEVLFFCSRCGEDRQLNHLRWAQSVHCVHTIFDYVPENAFPTKVPDAQQQDEEPEE